MGNHESIPENKKQVKIISKKPISNKNSLHNNQQIQYQNQQQYYNNNSSQNNQQQYYNQNQQKQQIQNQQYYNQNQQYQYQQTQYQNQNQQTQYQNQQNQNQNINSKKTPTQSAIIERNMLGDIYSRSNVPPLMPYPVSTQKQNLNAELSPYNFTEEVKKFKNDIDEEKVKFDDEERKRRIEFENLMEKKHEYLENQIKNFEEKYNPYKILELQKNETDLSNIKKAYKRMALKYHPDKVGDKYINEFQLVTQSYIYLISKVEKMNELNTKISKKVHFAEYVDDVNDGVENIYVDKDNFDLNKFNQIFDKYKLPDTYDDGYGDLYKEELNDKNTDNEIFGKKFNKEIFNSQFDSIKNKKSTEIIEYQEPDAIFASNTSGFSELGIKSVNNFGAQNNNILSYTDYKKAHVDETLLIDVNKVKYKQYNSIDQLESDRSKISYKASEDDILRYSHLDRMKKQKEDERQRYLQDRDEIINNQYKKLNNKLIINK
jgi:hypothetical protein